MSLPAVLAPVFIQVALTFVLMFWMGAVRTRSIQRGQVKVESISLGRPAWTEQGTKLGNAFRNQFELPVLFYVLVVLAIVSRKADLAFVIMSWLFVVLRILHAAIHTGDNDVPRRFYAYLAGALVLLVMWIIFAVRVLLG
jgi:hypothetical protein